MRCRNISKSGHFVLLIVLCFDCFGALLFAMIVQDQVEGL